MVRDKGTPSYDYVAGKRREVRSTASPQAQNLHALLDSVRGDTQCPENQGSESTRQKVCCRRADLLVQHEHAFNHDKRL